jgi:hypothetical protein
LLPSIKQEIEKLTKEYDRTINLISLGIDLQDYENFCTLTPSVNVSVGGDFFVLSRATRAEAEDVRWCIDFVVEFMLRSEASRQRAKPAA